MRFKLSKLPLCFERLAIRFARCFQLRKVSYERRSSSRHPERRSHRAARRCRLASGRFSAREAVGGDCERLQPRKRAICSRNAQQTIVVAHSGGAPDDVELKSMQETKYLRRMSEASGGGLARCAKILLDAHRFCRSIRLCRSASLFEPAGDHAASSSPEKNSLVVQPHFYRKNKFSRLSSAYSHHKAAPRFAHEPRRRRRVLIVY